MLGVITIPPTVIPLMRWRDAYVHESLKCSLGLLPFPAASRSPSSYYQHRRFKLVTLSASIGPYTAFYHIFSNVFQVFTLWTEGQCNLEGLTTNCVAFPPTFLVTPIFLALATIHPCQHG